MIAVTADLTVHAQFNRWLETHICIQRQGGEGDIAGIDCKLQADLEVMQFGEN